MNYIEFLHNRDKYLGENHDDFLMHYGVLGQKWGQRHWQNPDGTYTTEGKIRYFGSKKAQAEMNADETKIGSKTSDAKDYLKFRNKMLKEKEEKERKERETQERVQSLDNEIITDKYPKSSDKLTEEEFNKIANDLDTWYEDFHDGKTDKHSNTLVADLGINAMNNARGAGYAEVGDNGDRSWFMWEDQTLGLPDIAYLYTKGYSKDYIKGMLKYGKEKMYNLSDEDYENFRDKYPATSFVINEYHDGDKYIDSLFELKDSQDQKIGGWNLSKNNKPYYKELKSTVKELGLDKDGWDLDKKNGVLTKDFKDKDNKHNIGLFATTDKENMKKLTDKINKNYSKDNISKIFDDIREKATEKAYKKYVKDYKEWDLEDEILSREDFKNSIIIPKSIIFNNEGKTDTLYFELPYKPGTNWFIESYWTGDLDVDGNLSKLKFEWN